MMHDLFLVPHTDDSSLTLPHFTPLFGEKTTLELIANQTIYIETTGFFFRTKVPDLDNKLAIGKFSYWTPMIYS